MGKSQEEVAQSAGMDRSVYSRLESGQTCTTQTKAILIARFLQSTVEDLFGDVPSADNVTAPECA